MKVTGETITADQIRELRRELAACAFPGPRYADRQRDLWDDTEDALGVDPNAYTSVDAAGRAHRAARERVAALWNAREDEDD